MSFQFRLLIICIIGIILIGLFLFFSPVFPRDARIPFESIARWGILLDYDADNPISDDALMKFDMLIFDADNHPPLGPLKENTWLIAYVSVGEAEKYRSYWPSIRGQKWIIQENENWGGNYIVDISHRQWHQTLLDDVLPGVVVQGFDGIFMDTLDTADYLAYLDPQRFSHARTHMVELVRAIHKRYPQLKLISNNGLSIINEIGPSLSGALTENLFMMPDFENGGYKPVAEEEREKKIKKLFQVKDSFAIPIFIIDYVSLDEPTIAINVRKKIKALGFNPYIAEVELNKIYSYEN